MQNSFTADVEWVRVEEDTKEIPQPFPGEDREHPWRDKELFQTLYTDCQLSQNQLRAGWGCSLSTVGTWIKRHGIKKRTRSEAAQSWRGTLNCASYRVNNWGHVICGSDQDELMLHRLLAVSKWGFEALEGMHVHHKNEIPWDNRIENLELLTPSAHSSIHRKIRGLDRIRIAELYENGDISYRKLHEVLDYDNVTWNTLMDIHKESYGKEGAV